MYDVLHATSRSCYALTAPPASEEVATKLALLNEFVGFPSATPSIAWLITCRRVGGKYKWNTEIGEWAFGLSRAHERYQDGGGCSSTQNNGDYRRRAFGVHLTAGWIRL